VHHLHGALLSVLVLQCSCSSVCALSSLLTSRLSVIPHVCCSLCGALFTALLLLPLNYLSQSVLHSKDDALSELFHLALLTQLPSVLPVVPSFSPQRSSTKLRSWGWGGCWLESLSYTLLITQWGANYFG
jgi:hypothetical protein